MCLLILEKSLVYFYSTTESEMWDVAEKSGLLFFLSHSRVPFLIAGIGIPLAPQRDSLKS